ncbi:MAG: glycosyltransferase family 4 protein [Thermodesulfobacteriaceae bacterium]|nr:glycosyltransferase family 4 protein [Thermodesulfobacteriaceae bacterium]MCX8040881.1 glycosyltransferase family 4 protein [Thermodesulfobacteriaceae bacterium]MDW8135218.1 glycosyltransferase family 4 protein [Thermodesulfobacterium sp.]
MKLALIAQSFEEFKGGAERFSSELARYLIKKGVEIKLLARKIEPLDLKPYGIEIKIPKKPPSFRILTLSYLGVYLAKKWKADRIFAMMPLPEADFYWLAGGVYKYWLKINFPQTIKRITGCLLRPHFLINVFLQNKCFTSPHLKKIITISELEKEIAMKIFNLPADKFIVIPNGVDFTRFNPLVKTQNEIFRKKFGIPEKAKIVFFSGNNFKRKGLETLMKALARIKDSEELYLLIAGKDKTEYFLELSKKLKINNKVKFLGYVREIEKLYGLADVFVFPSKYDSFASVVIEAMACGVPVITTKTTGASMLIEHGKEGFILEKWDDEENLAKYILEVLKYSKEIGFKAYQKVLNYSIESCFERYYQVLTS